MTSQPVVRTSRVAVQGFWRDGSAAFLGIPFAEAPVGALRFGAPVPHGPWDGVRDATVYGATAQRRPFGEVTAIPEPSIPGESTLNVNVFTPSPQPAEPTELLPVLVWIHGGGYKAGSPASPWYDGAAFNRDGVVTVTLSYRLGFDGFGWVEDAPHNRGLLDQIEALRWVQREIAAFGGDPTRVTIAGQSAGGGSVLALLASPMARGLFHGAISQSGALDPPSKADARALGQRVAELAGVPCTRAGLAALSEDELLDLQDTVEAERARHPQSVAQAVTDTVAAGLDLIAFVPYLDGEVLTTETDLAAALSDPASQSIPLLIGSTAHEFTQVGAMFAELPGDLGAALADSRLDAAAPQLLESFADLPEAPGYGLGQLITELTFRVPVVAVAGARDEGATWVYDFAYARPGDGLAPHCVDLPFVWDCLDAERVTASTGDDPPQALADEMHSDWVEFVRTGAVSWPRWDQTEHTTKTYATPSRVGPGYALEVALEQAGSHA